MPATHGERSRRTGIVADEYLRVRGARMHNLQGIDIDIPLEKLVVLTGLSGSGKSSLAIDTIFAEGQRQYVDSLSVHARQYFHQWPRPELTSIENLPPTVCIDQRSGGVNPRSTVGTLSEIQDFLRVLFARAGVPLCPKCGEAVQPRTVEEIARQLSALPDRTKLILLAPLVRGRQGKHLDVFDRIRKARLIRVRVDGTLYDIDSVPPLKTRQTHTIEAVVDRLVVRPELSTRLIESLRTAVDLGDGMVVASAFPPEGDVESDWTDLQFSTRYACVACGASLLEIEPRTFSFNSPYGACPECDGLGRREQFDVTRVVPDRSKSLQGGGVAPWRGLTAAARKLRLAELAPLLKELGIDGGTSLQDLSDDVWHRLLHRRGKRPGLLQLLERELATATNDDRLQELEALRDVVVCPHCRGTRLRPEALAVRLGGLNIAELSDLPLEGLAAFFAAMELEGAKAQVLERILREIRPRIEFLQQVGLSYLTLSRPVDTLSGGELQRTRLAAAIGSGLTGVCFVLDEPSVGLHPRDNDRLLAALHALRDRGNSLLVVEHDEPTMRSADWLIDLGPGAGRSGGQLVAAGTPADVARGDSSTGQYLRGALSIPVPTRRPIDTKKVLRLEGARGYNLREIDVEFPLGTLIAVTGVSGSGKSTLVQRTLAPAIREHLGLVTPRPAPFRRLRGVEQIERLVLVDQRPLGRTSRGCAATYTGVMDEIRKLFAATKMARGLGLTAAHFSFNSARGWCESCKGAGLQKIEMTFLPDLQVTCSACQGNRFNAQTLRVRYRERTIADVLNLPIGEAMAFFSGFARITTILQCLCDVGLDHLSLGQSSATLSGGEAQRIRLATELAQNSTRSQVYILDEPTTGLHFEDVRRLLRVLGKLVDQANTVIVIEHHLDVIKSADWVIDIGPEGGAAGGLVVAAGTPEEVAGCAASITGRFLQPLLQHSRSNLPDRRDETDLS